LKRLDTATDSRSAASVGAALLVVLVPGACGVIAGADFYNESGRYLFHFAGAQQSGTRTARIEKAMPAIFEGRGFLERR